MAAILFVSDYKMIEYHRLNGSETINFWRPKAQTNIAKLEKNDLVFFLTTTMFKQGVKNEKGVVGYGKLEQEKNLSFNTMWSTYQTKNGFDTKEQFKNAILEYTDEIPQKIKCLEIKDVLFFNNPIYLSELGINIPKNLESYSYLEAETVFGLLEKASILGIDTWSLGLNSDKSEEQFSTDLITNKLRYIYKQIPQIAFNPTEITKNNRVKKELLANKFVLLDSATLYKIENDKVVLAIIALLNNDNDKIKALIGMIYMWLVRSQSSKQSFEIQVYTTENISREINTYFGLQDNIQVYIK